MYSKNISKALECAAMAHEGSYRKGTKVPYIVHPVEAGLITMSMTDDEEVVIAAILHDVVEDTEYMFSDIEMEFGLRVADLVSYESEDKMRDIPAEDSWKVRKEVFLKHLSEAPIEAKIICLADKLSNMRMSVKTYAELGDDMWLVFNQKDKKLQEWYYRSIYEKIPELSDTDAYKEYVSCCDEVFGKQDDCTPTRRCYQNHCQVMYDPLIPEQNRIDKLVDFVSDEINDVSHFFDDLHIAGELTPPYVFLSDKVLYRSYGRLSDKDLIEALKKYTENMKHTEMYEYFQEIIKTIIYNLEMDINRINEKANPEVTWSDCNLTMTGAERIVELEGTADDKEALSGIIDILSMRKVDNLLLGEYLSDRHQIMIYYNAIERECDRTASPNMDFYAKLSSVVAHEYFHAMHHALAPGHVLWSNSNYQGFRGYQKKEITEALADFFSVLWCFDRAKTNNGYVFMDVARDRFDSWKKYLYSAWPYSKALYLMKDPLEKRLPYELDPESVECGRHSLLPVFETSVRDIIKSYELLKG